MTGAGSGREGLLAAARAELAEHGHAAISLRAVARRAGVSHAAPKHHFGDRAGLLTAVATDGFTALARALELAGAAEELPTDDPGGPARVVAALGLAYIDFGVREPALFDLMFRPSELREDDAALRAAQRRAIGILAAAVAATEPPVTMSMPPPSGGVPPLALISWALVHGLVLLSRDGALTGALAGDAAPDDAPDDAELARSLVDVFTAQIALADHPPPHERS